MKRGSSASSTAGSHTVLQPATAFSRSTSRPATQPGAPGPTPSPARWPQSTLVTVTPRLAAMVMASFTTGFRGTCRPPRIPASIVMTKVLRQSSRRCATASAEKPPKMTLWMAPAIVQLWPSISCYTIHNTNKTKLFDNDICVPRNRQHTDASAGEAGDAQREHHRHIDGDGIPFLDPELPETISHAAGLVEELLPRR